LPLFRAIKEKEAIIMKKMVSMMILVALFLTASFVSADPREPIRDPANGWRGMCRCHQEDQAKLDKTFKAFEDEAAKILQPVVERKRQSPRSFRTNVRAGRPLGKLDDSPYR